MKKMILVASLLINLVLLATIVYIGNYRTDYFHRVYANITHEPYVPIRVDNDCVLSWNNCVEKLNITVDVVFFGDSHIAEGNFHTAFSDVSSINLGYIGEDTKGMLRRVEAIAAVHPKKVFLMAGINGLYNQSLEDFEYRYSALVDAVCAHTDAKLYVISILPVTASSCYCNNEKIAEANTILAKLAYDKNIVYIDLHSKYEISNALPDEMSSDGLHLTEEAYEIWYDAISQYIKE